MGFKNTSKEETNVDSSSVDDFIKTLEEKEKDLDISSDLVIEVDENDLPDEEIPDFLKSEIIVDEKAIKKSSTISASNSKMQNVDNSDELFRLNEKLARIKAERDSIGEALQRRQRDFDSYRKRTERERGETFSKVVCNVATQILPVIDNLNRALDTCAGSKKNIENKEFLQFIEGVALVNQQLNDVLASMGVEKIPAIGEVFNPEYHEAVATEVNDEVPPQTITEEMLSGYQVGGKVIRASMVKVSTSNHGDTPQKLKDSVSSKE